MQMGSPPRGGPSVKTPRSADAAKKTEGKVPKVPIGTAALVDAIPLPAYAKAAEAVGVLREVSHAMSLMCGTPCEACN